MIEKRMNQPTRHLSLLLLTGTLTAQAADPSPLSDAENTGEWVLKSAVSDEFNTATLDTNKWVIQGAGGHYENNFKGRAPSQFDPGNVDVKNGQLHITTKWDPEFAFAKELNNGHRYGNITTGAIISKQHFLHGYMETRCKAAKGPTSSSFWTTGKGGELDVFEHWGANTKNDEATTRYHSSIHDWRKGSPTIGQRIWTNKHLLNFEVGDDFHVYGFEWAEDYIRIYIDGGLVRTVLREEIGDAWVIDQEQKVWFDSEIFPWEVKPAELKARDFLDDGLVFAVDYVRIWQRKGKGNPTETRSNLIKNPGFELGLEGWSHDGGARAESNSQCEGTHAAFLHKRCSLEQTVPLQPNTTYILSGWISLPGTDYKSTYHHGDFGVKGYGGDELRIKSTAPDFTRYSLQFTTSDAHKSATVFFTNDRKSQPALGDRFELYEVPKHK
jgi:beta-glucanase (GH16 family)